jgi:acetyl esterase/lipase/uncharacterized protein YciI
MRLALTIIIFLFFNWQAFSQETKNLDSTNVRHHWDIFYTETQDSLQSLDVYWNSKSKDAKVLMFVHGGGWLSGDKKQYREMASSLAENGLTIVLINYRLSPKVKFPSHIEDVASAIHWAESSIGTYNGNKENIYLMGHSAGGHLISLLLFDKSYLEKHEMIPSDIAGAITISSVFEIKPQEGGATEKYLEMVFGDNETIWESATCKNHIDAETKNKIPPFLISWGKEESKLIVDESQNIINELNDNKIEFQSFTFESKNHYAFKDDLTDSKSDFYKMLIRFMSQKTNPNYDSNLATKLGADDYGMKIYILVILKTGSNVSDNKALKDSCFSGHLNNINRLVKEKKLIVAGPMVKNEKSYRGIFILDVSTIEDANLLLETDPAIKAKFLEPELYEWYGSAALPEYLEASDKVWKIGF